jgi:hypothetical protein
MIIGKAISPFGIKRRNGNGGNDADAQAFITASGISGTNATAVNTLVVNLKAANVWTKMKAIYPMVGGTATSCKWNLKNPVDSNAAYRLVFSGGATFSSNGVQFNGTNAYADTFFIPSVNGTLNSSHISYYSRTNSNGTEVEMGTNISGAVPVSILEIRTAGVTYSAINSGASYTTFTDANSLGFYTGNRTASNVIKLHKNASIVASGTTASTSQSTNSFTIGALNQGTGRSFYTTKQCAFASIGDGLTDAEALAFYNAVQTFNTTLARQV